MARQSALNAASGLRGTPNGGASPRHHRRSSSVHIPGPSSPLQLRSPARVQPPPQTPRPRRKNPSLHKAVLVRSAHRAYVASIAPPQEEEEDETEHLVSFNILWYICSKNSNHTLLAGASSRTAWR